MNTIIGRVETGNEVHVRFVITAPTITPAATSTAVTFTRHNPDGTEQTVSSPNAAITGPTAGTTTIDGTIVATTTWTWRTPTFTQPGVSTVRARSTAGMIASDNSAIVTPSYAPMSTA